jgi:Flp pilus assembly protein TadD
MNPFSDALQKAFAAFDGGRFEEAERLGRELLAAPTTSGELFFLLGLVANKAGRHAESVLWLERAAEMSPPSVRLLSALGGACHAAGDLPRAAECFTRCLQLDPQCSEAWHQLGNVCYARREMELAAQAYRRATELDPENAAIWNNLANTLRNLGDLDEALAAYARALAGRPDDPVIHANRGRTLLAAGRLDEGFREFEFRWEPLGLRHYPQPVWQGEPLPGKTLFVFAEQGIGDTIQFVRYLRLARERVGRIVLECHTPLQSLLTHSRCADVVIAADEEPPPFDVYAPLLHLPSIFRTTLETVPASVPYLSSITTVSLPAMPKHNLKVGLAWAGNPDFLDDAIRSIPLEQFANMLGIGGVSFFSLQLNIPARDESFFRSSSLINLMPQVQNFEDTANLIARLDLVISVDTAVAHLAGALAKPVWTLLPHPPDWRWLLHRTDTPWYPTMRLFRQSRTGDWQPVLARAAAELQSLIQRHAVGRNSS